MTFHLVSVVITAIFVALIAYPIFIHLVFGWVRKANDVILPMSSTW
jgi:hypothetical protein